MNEFIKKCGNKYVNIYINIKKDTNTYINKHVECNDGNEVFQDFASFRNQYMVGERPP